MVDERYCADCQRAIPDDERMRECPMCNEWFCDECIEDYRLCRACGEGRNPYSVDRENLGKTHRICDNCEKPFALSRDGQEWCDACEREEAKLNIAILRNDGFILQPRMIQGGQGKSDDEAEAHAEACLLITACSLAAIIGGAVGYAFFVLFL